MRSNHVIRTGVALLLLAAVLAVSACSYNRATPSGQGVAGTGEFASGAANVTSSVSASGSANASASGSAKTGTSGNAAPGTAGSTPKPKRKGLTSSDVKAIDAELSAIERELDNMSLPSDSDFGGLESGLE